VTRSGIGLNLINLINLLCVDGDDGAAVRTRSGIVMTCRFYLGLIETLSPTAGLLCGHAVGAVAVATVAGAMEADLHEESEEQGGHALGRHVLRCGV
jgi:hypothetical protein